MMKEKFSNMNCGLVGLPNVGKSTLFNALNMNAKAVAANFPFCTVEPNVGIVAVPDERLDVLAKKHNSQKVVPAHLTFVDIAGLVRGASKGEGLGNQFLSHIRQVDAILHVVRCFESDDVVHVEGRVDPVQDIETVETELLLADLQSLERRLSSKKKDVDYALLQKVHHLLAKGQPASQGQWAETEQKAVEALDLLSSKPVIYVANIQEGQSHHAVHVQAVESYAKKMGRSVVILCNELESQLSELSSQERLDMLACLGLEMTGLSRVIRKVYDVLGLITFFTAGPKEVHAWTLSQGDNAWQAAGKIHTDFQKGFIRAQVLGYEDFLSCESFARAQELGKVRIEGKEYIFQDGDIALFRFNV